MLGGRSYLPQYYQLEQNCRSMGTCINYDKRETRLGTNPENGAQGVSKSRSANIDTSNSDITYPRQVAPQTKPVDSLMTSGIELNSLSDSHNLKLQYKHMVQPPSNIERDSKINRLAEANGPPSDFFVSGIACISQSSKVEQTKNA